MKKIVKLLSICRSYGQNHIGSILMHYGAIGQSSFITNNKGPFGLLQVATYNNAYMIQC